MKRFISTTLALLLAAGCQAHPPTGTTRRPVATKSAAPVTTASQRVVGALDPLVTFTGTARLISDNGLGVISNNSGSIISNNGSGLISDNGLGYRTLAVKGESLLADAAIQVLDAQGKVLVGADKKPLTATTDKQGAYTFKGKLPDENLVLRIRLYNGGTLSALLTRADGAGDRTVDLDTASTLSAQYVLTKYVKGDKSVYARLPAAEAAKLRDVMAEAVKNLDEAPSYKDDALVEAAEALRAQSKGLDAQLTRIQALLLLGQANLGTGRAADSVGITNPVAVYRDATGVTYIAESLGRIRRVGTDGKISLYGGAKAVVGGVDGGLALISDMAGQPDGTLFVAEYGSHKVEKIGPTGKLTTIAGGGSSKASSGQGTDLELGKVHRVALGAKGVVYFSESSSSVFAGRVMKLTPDGQCTSLPMLGSAGNFAEAFGLAEAPDGTVYAMVQRGVEAEATYGIERLKPGATSWEAWYKGMAFTNEERMALGPDGKLYFGNAVEGRLYRTAITGAPAPEIVPGGGSAGQSGPFEVIRGFWLDDDGSWLVVNGSRAIVHAVTASGQVSRFAGVEGTSTIGDGLGLALNGPMAITVDPDGNFVFTESNHLIKRLKGQTVELVAGDLKLGSLPALCYHKGDLYMADANDVGIYKLSPDGKLTLLAGHGVFGMLVTREIDAKEATFGKVAGIAVDDQDRVWFTDATHHQLLRLDPDGMVRLVAGAVGKPGNLSTAGDKGDGGPAADALLNSPGGLAIDRDGNVYVADSANFRVRKVAKDGTISTFAGAPRLSALGRMLSGKTDEGDVKAADALFVGPGSLWFGPDGSLYVNELGTIALKLAGGVAGGQTEALPVAVPDISARVRKVSPSGTVSIVAGPGGKALTDPDADDALYAPTSLAIDGQGRLAIIDVGANQIKILPAGSY